MKLKLLLWLGILAGMPIDSGAQNITWLKHSTVVCGAGHMEEYLKTIGDKPIGLVANATSRVGNVHLLDTLLASGVSVRRVFAPEHGFRGEEEAGATIVNGIDPRTRVPVISLYGTHKKPTREDLAGLQMIVFDIQDVGARFYTYISTLHYVMEACAEKNIPLLVLDRPNPNGFYIDGPILDTAYRSFVGMHPVPVVHGMTIGEYARMVNGERWLKGGIQCSLEIVKCTGYDHQTEYVLPVKPSPNLPNQVSVYLYPSLCFFEGTVISVGRGTAFPFQVYGHPDLPGDFAFTPVSVPGISLHPPFEDRLCHGRDLREGGLAEFSKRHGLILDWVIEAYREMKDKKGFFTGYFDTLAGTDQLRLQVIKGLPADEIRKGWLPGLREFQKVRARYLLYPDNTNPEIN